MDRWDEIMAPSKSLGVTELPLSSVRLQFYPQNPGILVEQSLERDLKMRIKKEHVKTGMMMIPGLEMLFLVPG